MPPITSQASRAVIVPNKLTPAGIAYRISRERNLMHLCPMVSRIPVIHHGPIRPHDLLDHHHMMLPHRHHARGGRGMRKLDPVRREPQFPQRLAEYLHRRPTATKRRRRTPGGMRQFPCIDRGYSHRTMMAAMHTHETVRMNGHHSMCGMVGMVILVLGMCRETEDNEQAERENA